MRFLFTVGLLAFIYHCTSAQGLDIRSEFKFKSTSYQVLVFKSGLNKKYKFSFMENTKRSKDSDMFLTDSSIFAITASIVDSSCKPLGLFIVNGETINGINLESTGKGNFYTLENGVLSFIEGGRIVILPSKLFNYEDSIKYAIQTGPMLIWNNTVNSAFNSSSSNTNFRCGVGVFYSEGKEFVVFAKSNAPVNFYEFSTLFAEVFKCNRALALESGNSCAIHLPGKRSNTIPKNDNVICRYLTINFHDLGN